MQPDDDDAGASNRAQEMLSAHRSRSLALVSARAALRRQRRQRAAPIDEGRIEFDLVDGHWS